MRREHALGLATMALVESLALGAGRAEAAPTLSPESQSSKAGGDLNWWSAKGAGSTFGLIPFLQYGFADRVYLTVHAPVAVNVNGPGSKGYAGIGNPTVGLHYAATTRALTWYLGARAAIPLATVHDSGWRTAMVLGNSSTAGLDVHYWLPQYLPIGAYGGVEYLASNAFIVRGEVAPQLFIPIEDAISRGTDNKARFIYTARVEAEGRADGGLGGGIALHLMHNPSADGDNAQSAFEGFGSYDNGKFFGRLGLLVALDEPFGFGFDQGQVATARARAGVRF
ncbi:hypothetical protein LVJ94_10165 [Pendulispora rubella]|uniref:Transporter n=1 Tax=Pendulispora rubella TaxID=2741070 RepID=A0ABZ2L9K0_9BACT